jgi:hypothetical protein
MGLSLKLLPMIWVIWVLYLVETEILLFGTKSRPALVSTDHQPMDQGVSLTRNKVVRM